MNRIVASVGLVALGAASVQAQSAISAPPHKWWNVSATVRGFYDDNANTAPTDGTPGPVRTFGYDLSPSVGINLGNQQTTFSATYTFSYLYYEKNLTPGLRNSNNELAAPQKDDLDHTFTTALDHSFSERYSIHFSDAFVVGQDPDTLRTGPGFSGFQRISGNNIVNNGTVTFDGQLTPVFGFEAGYKNDLYDYDASEIAGPLNRDENYAHFDARFTVSPETVAVLGYQFGDVIYTGTGQYATNIPNPTVTNPNNQSDVSVRDTISHTVYVGADHTFLPQLVGSVRAGASYYDYYNDPNGGSDFGPYAQASLAYTYAPESSFSIGFQEGRNASSLVSSNSLIHDTETSVAYATLVHRIVPKLYGTLKGTFQNTTYHGGGPGVDGKSDQFYEAEADLLYKFNANFSFSAGYQYDLLKPGAEIGPSSNYQRNQVYIGATASY